ncbi:MAG: SDR family NAD(P)-dependent oxidoreductase [Anaerolineae bacterium]
MDERNDLKGKTIVVTGATSGIGRAVVQALALGGAHVIGVGRSPDRCCFVQEAVSAASPGARLSFAIADLASQGQVRSLNSEIRRMVEEAGADYIDVLINNAGTVSSWRKVTEDGYELQFAVNHLAPFLLTLGLLPLLQAAPSGRVVTVSSGSHYKARMNWRDLMYRRHYSCLRAYKQSKLANVLFTVELNRRLGKQSPVRAYAADPGLVDTGIGQKGTSGLEKLVWKLRRRRGASPEEGAKTIVYLATQDLAENADRVYWKACRPKQPSASALQAEDASRLWTISERLCGLGDDAESAVKRGQLQSIGVYA